MTQAVSAAALVSVPFRNTTLSLVDHRGHPYVPMRPVVEGMGMDWKSQHVKLTASTARWTVVEITTVAEDGKRRRMTCLSLRKLPGWLATISPNKVRPDLRDTIIAYQNECDDVLWAHWSNRQTVAQSAPAALLQGQRWIAELGANGQLHLTPITDKHQAMRPEGVPAWLQSPEFPIHYLPEVMQAAAARLAATAQIMPSSDKTTAVDELYGGFVDRLSRARTRPN